MSYLCIYMSLLCSNLQDSVVGAQTSRKDVLAKAVTSGSM